MVFASENPFRTQRIHALPYIFADDTMEAVLARFEAAGGRGAIVGPHGHGKSTLVSAMERELAARGVKTQRVLLNDATAPPVKAGIPSRIAASAPGTVILFDGAERLGWLAWRRVLRASQGRGLLITSHRGGRLPTIYTCRTTPEIFEELLSQLLGDETEVWRGEALGLYGRYGGDVRSVWFDLYERYAEGRGERAG